MNRKEIDELASEGTFGESSLNGHVTETHISWVIFSDKLAFKIKKPVKLSFLDFSTLELRKKYCERELLLNKKWCDIYKQVSPVMKTGKKFVLGDHGDRIVDYAVVMRRVDEELKMDVMLANNRVTVPHVLALGSHLAKVHSNARIIRRKFSLEYARHLFNEIGSFSGIIGKIGGPDLQDLVERSIHWSDRFLAEHVNRFRERIRLGFQRDVHGDLHSGNIFLEDKPVIFDCIEFNDRYRQIDVLYEIGFLAMDIEAYQHPRLAAALVHEYTDRLKCIEGPEDLLILNYYKCLRANVRAKVHLIEAASPADPHTMHKHAIEARRYLHLMKDYTSHH